MEKQKPLALLEAAELRTIHILDQRKEEAWLRNALVNTGRKIDPYMAFDARKSSIEDRPDLCSYIDKQNKVLERESLTAVWHSRKKGQLSKKLDRRPQVAMAKLIADFSKKSL